MSEEKEEKEIQAAEGTTQPDEQETTAEETAEMEKTQVFDPQELPSSLKTEAAPRKKKSKLKSLVIWLAFIIIILGLTVFGFDIYNDYSGFLKPYGKQTIDIPAGADTDDVTAILKEQGIVKYPTFYKLYIKFSKKGGSFMRGVHTVTTDLGYAEVTKSLSGAAENTVKVTIPEGYWLTQIVDRFVEKGIGTKDAWQKALGDSYDFDFLNAAKDRESKLEGYLFPDTYEFYADDTPETVIKTMLTQFKKVITENDIEAKAKLSGMTLDDTVKLASVIQSEVPTMSEMKKVSAVFHNRLNINMKLQSCVTVLYALGQHKSFVTIADTKVESPYNTYYVDGLPKGPISAPGADALIAAVTPDTDITAGNYLYFYSPDSDTVIYSKTYADHQKAIAKYRGGTGTAAAR